MNKTWSVVLIILACLAVLSGTYWYFVLRPETPNPPAEQVEAALAPQQPPLVQAAVPPKVEQQKQAEAPPVQEPPVRVDQPAVMEIPIEQPDMANIAELPPPIDPLLQSGLLKLPTTSAPDVLIPYAAPAPLVMAASKPEQPKPEPVAEPVVPKPVFARQPIVEEERAPEPVMEEKVVLTPMAPRTPQIPTTRVQVDTEPLNWTIGTAVSFANFDLPLKRNGFSVQVDVLKHTRSLFAFGGALEYGQIDGNSFLSTLAKGQWTLRKDQAFTIPVSVSLGPTFFFGTSTEFGLTAKVLAGFSYEIVRNMRFFYQSGIQAQWVITSSDFKLTLEPMRVGFSYSF